MTSSLGLRLESELLICEPVAESRLVRRHNRICTSLEVAPVTISTMSWIRAVMMMMKRETMRPGLES